MLTSLSLRTRIFLFFAALALGAILITLLALWQGYSKGGGPSAFVQAGIITGFGILGLSAGIWLLFDENVAKPIERLAAQLRARAHGGVATPLSEHDARYLGDLAPAAQAITEKMTAGTMATAESVAMATAKLSQDMETLTALLTEIPVAMIMVSASHKIVLYDGQAADALGQVAPPRLQASIFDYIDETCLRTAYAKLQKTGLDVRFDARGAHGVHAFEAQLKPLGNAPGYMLVLEENKALPTSAPRPLVYDFDLLKDPGDDMLYDKPLRSLSFAVFDTETTGLLPHKDEIVQIGAVRVVNGKLVRGEQIDTIVNPGMAIPRSSTAIHGITDAMVHSAPDIRSAAREFHQFCSDSVIIAHNAPFDMAFLRRHARACELEWSHPILDTVLLSAIAFGQSEEHTLDALSQRLGVNIDEQHRHTALGDALATAQVFCKLLPMLEAKGLDTLARVIDESRKHGRLLDDANA